MNFRFFNKIILIDTVDSEIWDVMQMVRTWKPDRNIKSTNPTPRKCRGHKRPSEFIEGKCVICGGVK